MSLFPHQKLDWALGRLERRVQEVPDDRDVRLELAAARWARTAFHGGAEEDLQAGLAQARHVLSQEPSEPRAHVLAGLALLGLGQRDVAGKHLAEARSLAEDRADVHYALARWHEAATDAEGATGPGLAEAISAAEEACRLAPDAWESHALLASLLWALVQAHGGPARVASAPERPLPRSTYHAVRALDLSPPASVQPELLFHVGMTSFHAGRLEDANRVLSRLLQHEDLRGRAEYYLGLVHFQMGHFKNAVIYLRKHLEHSGDSARAHARTGLAHLELGELDKARRSCEQAAALDPGDLQSRWTLGCVHVQTGRDDEAMATFREILREAPDHTPAFRELALLHARRAEVGWLRKALESEAKAYHRVSAQRDEQGVSPRQATRERVTVVVQALVEVLGAGALEPLLAALDMSNDEGLRMQLWEGALDALSAHQAAHAERQLEHPGMHYSAAGGRQVLALAQVLPADRLVLALQIQDEDLRRQAVERHGPARDVTEHRRAINHERREARAWQALLLLALASQGAENHRELLEQWAAEADPDLGDAARAALVMLGDDDAAVALRKRAHPHGAQNLVDAMVAQVRAPELRTPVRAADPQEERVCATCGRYTEDVEVMMLGGAMSMCNVCLGEVARGRDKLRIDDPDRTCDLSGRGGWETSDMYRYRGVAVCAEVVEAALGLLEQRAVNQFLRAQP